MIAVQLLFFKKILVFIYNSFTFVDCTIRDAPIIVAKIISNRSKHKKKGSIVACQVISGVHQQKIDTK